MLIKLSLVVALVCIVRVESIEHHCIHDEISSDFHPVKVYQEYPEGLHERMQQMLRESFQSRSTRIKVREPGVAPIRVVTELLYLDTDLRRCTAAGDEVYMGTANAGSPYCNTTAGITTDCIYNCTEDDILTANKKTHLVNEVLAKAITFLQDSLMVVPVSGNLSLASGTCSGPTTVVSTSYSDADVVLMITARPTRPGVVAHASTCQTDNINRPILGVVNFGPVHIDTAASEVDLDSYIAVAVHEIIHAFGFSGSNLKETGSTFNTSETIVQSYTVGNGTTAKTARFVVTPTVVQVVRAHFGCSTLPGAEIEDGGGSGTAGSHWEKRVYNNDFMTGTTSKQAVLAELTFAALQDSGWYYINENATFAQPTWGYGRGCAFAMDNCVISDQVPVPWTSHSCVTPRNDGGRYCTHDYLAKAECQRVSYATPLPSDFQYFSDPEDGGMSAIPDYCPLIQAFSNGDCRAPNDDASLLMTQYGEGYSADSRCFLHNMLNKKYVNSETPMHGCYSRVCVSDSEYKIKVKDYHFTCTSGTDKIQHPEFHGELSCVDPYVLCNTTLFGVVYDDDWPSVDAVSPNKGTITGGTSITISGTGFVQGSTVTVAGVSCSISSLSNDSVSCKTSDMSKTVYNENEKALVIVTLPNGKTAGVVDGFTLEGVGLLEAGVEILKDIYNFISPLVQEHWYGGLSLVVLIVCIVVYCCMKRHKKKKQQKQVEHMMTDMESRRHAPRRAWADDD